MTRSQFCSIALLLYVIALHTVATKTTPGETLTELLLIMLAVAIGVFSLGDGGKK